MLSEDTERIAITVCGALVAVLLVVALAGALRLGGHEPAAALSAGTGTPTVATARSLIQYADLESALAGAGIVLPPRTNVYAAIVREVGDSVRLEEFEAGGGASADDFWPASSVKQMAALGALEFLNEHGFTGSAVVTFEGEEVWTAQELYQEAIVDSDNLAYDRLVELAGIDWLNDEFLTPERGFPETVIQKSYTTLGPVPSAPVMVREGEREMELPPRPPSSDRGIPDDGNRSTVREMAESVSRVVMNDALPPDRRYRIPEDDLLGVRQALLAAESFVSPGIYAALGPATLVYSKPGWVLDADCVDVAYVQTVDRARTYLLGITTPDDGQDCATLVDIARHTMTFLTSQT